MNVLLGTLMGKLAVALAAVITALGGLGIGGVLPDPVQEVVADVGDALGVELPDPDDDAGANLGPDDPGDETDDDAEVDGAEADD